jgi:enoyl-CoA hydratase/crotonobetainyl-CoA hydratase
MTVQLDVNDGVGLITLDRPAVHNAIDRRTAELLSDALDEIESRDDVVVGVLTGAGRTFCAGADLHAFHLTGELPVTSRRGGMGMVEHPPSKPMIAAVQGRAVGGGLELALACDLIVAEEGVVFGLPEVQHGLIASGGGLLRLPRRIPRALACELILTGDLLSARRAADLGLVNRLVPRGEAVEAARAIARGIAANAPLAVRAAKRVLDEAVDWPREEMFARQAEHTGPVLSSIDAAEGARAFSERRRPTWLGA